MKTGLVLEGGAMRGLFSAGVMDVLMEHQITFEGQSAYRPEPLLAVTINPGSLAGLSGIIQCMQKIPDTVVFDRF